MEVEIPRITGRTTRPRRLVEKDAMARAAQNGHSKEARECADWMTQQVKDHPTVQNRVEWGDASAYYDLMETMRQAEDRFFTLGKEPVQGNLEDQNEQTIRGKK